MKIQKKLMFTILIPVLILFISVAIVDLNYQKKKRIDQLNEEILKTNELLSLINIDPLWSLNFSTLKITGNIFLARKEIVKYILIEMTGDVIVNRQEKIKADIEYEIKIKKDDLELGTLLVGYTYKPVNMEIWKLEIIITIYALIMLFFLIVIIYHISKWISIPIDKISAGLIEIDGGNYNTKVDLQKNSEFKNIEIYFNKMSNSLKKSKLENIKSEKMLINKNLEIESAYNQMMSINETLTITYKELEDSGDKYRKIFNYAPVGMMILNVETNKIKEFNKGFSNILGMREDEMLGLTIDNIFKKENIINIKNKLKKSETISNMELNLKIVPKTIIFSSIIQDSKKSEILIAIKDITELKKMQEKLEEYAKKLEEKVNERTKELEKANKKIRKQQEKMVEAAYNQGLIEVTSGIIHNIGNVVNILNLNLEELLYEIPSEESKVIKFFRDIVYCKLQNLEEKDEELQKIEQVMPKIIDYIKYFENKIKKDLGFIIKKSIHLKEIIKLQQSFVGGLGTEDYNNIDEIVNEVVEIYGFSIDKREINLNLVLDAQIKILCDKSQMFQVIGNLIKNAYEAIEEKNEENGLIEIKTSINKNNDIELIVKDNGIGIEKEKVKKVFNFGYSTKKINLKGTGFGLHSTKIIVEKYGGKLEMFSEIGNGTECRITLPLIREEEKKVEEKNKNIIDNDINNK